MFDSIHIPIARRTWLTAILIGLLILGSISAVAQDTTDSNLTDSCVTDYDPTRDYFPDKVAIDDAENLSVAYFNNYKVVTVLNAYDGAEAFSYVLVQCGTPAPEADDFADGTQFIEVPAQSIISLSTTQLPHLSDLGLLDALVAVDSGLFINNPDVRAAVASGAVVEVGSGSSINVELVLDLAPSLVMTYGFNPAFDAHPVLIDAGVFTALNAEWREPTPLGRAEWLKYTALFFNAEAQATEVYDAIVVAYDEARALAATVPADARPVVLWNTFSTFTDAWSVPGSETYVGRLMTDAGGAIALSAIAIGNTSTLASFETVYDGAIDADIWIANVFDVNTLDDLLAQDERYGDFAAVANGQVWNNSRQVNENGGNNYFELGVTNPQLVLRDLIAIFHPDLLPDHEFNFFVQLEPAG